MNPKYTLYVKFTSELAPEAVVYYNQKKGPAKEDSGFDLVVDTDYQITDDSDIEYIDFKINCAMVDNNTGKTVGYYLYPRSSFSKYRLIMGNHVGIIDAGYRGNIMAAVRLYGSRRNSSPENIDKMARLFQLCAPDLSPFNVEIVDTLPLSMRGTGGFGSTGK